MLGWMTTWGIRCGIATYSSFLIDNLDEQVVILAQSDGAPEDDIARCWERKNGDFSRLLERVEELEIKKMVIQHHPGQIIFKHLSSLLNSLSAMGIEVSITLHNTRERPLVFRANRIDKAVKALKNCKNIFVHTKADVLRLNNMGISENIHHIPHGIYPPPNENTQPIIEKKGRTMATFGFMMPHKGQPELIEVFNQLTEWDELWLLCAEVDSSAEVLKRCNELSDDRVKIIGDFLADDVAIATLAQADLVVFPYQSTKESASGAVRMAVAAGAAIAVTPLEIFSDIEAAIVLPGVSVEEMLLGISNISDDGLINSKNSVVLQRDNQQWSSIAKVIEGLLR